MDILLKKDVRHNKKLNSRKKLWKLKDDKVTAAFKAKVVVSYIENEGKDDLKISLLSVAGGVCKYN